MSQIIATYEVAENESRKIQKKLQKTTGKLGFGSNLLKNKDRASPIFPETQFLGNWENGC